MGADAMSIAVLLGTLIGVTAWLLQAHGRHPDAP